MSFILLSCAHHERPARESASAEPIEVTEEGTWQGQPYVALAFRPLLTDAAHERLTPEEARAFVTALEEALDSTGVGVSLRVTGSWRDVNPVTDLGVEANEEWHRTLAEYATLYGLPDHPLPVEIPDDRFATAFMLSVKHMPEGVRAGAEELFNSRTVIMAIVASGLTYLGLWLAPEPALSKSIAAGITITLMAIYGVSEIINLATAFMQFYNEVSAATTMAELDAAAKRFGERIGKAGLRILAMVAGGAVSKKLPDMRVRDLKSLIPQVRQFMAAGPNGAKVVVQVVEGTSAQVNVSNGTAVLMGVSVNTAGAAATTAMASARTTGDCRPKSDKGDAKRHHIATDKNTESDKTGGPWTPLFEDFFRKAGMNLQDSANIVYVIKHQGPHPQDYHEEIYRRIRDALAGCRATADCRSRLVDELDKIAGDICKPGSTLNKLLKKQP